MLHSLFSSGRKIVVSAPMAGYSDAIYRRFAKKFGADLTFTEMISAEGFLRDSDKTIELMRYAYNEKPIAVQFFSGVPDAIFVAAEKVSGMGFCAFDINMGCSVRKVLKHGAGAALLNDLDNAEKIVVAAMQTKIPVSVKVRSGFSSEDEWQNILVFLKRVEEIGAAFVSIHPRTAAQKFSGKANWKLIAEAVKCLKIPVIASGDIFSIEDAAKVIEMTDAAGVMLARGAISNFQLFSQVKMLFQGKNLDEIAKISFSERAETILDFVEAEVKIRGEARAIRWCRKFFIPLLAGFSGARQMRKKVSHIENFAQLKSELFVPLMKMY